MALTATATTKTRKDIITRLCMNDPAIIYLPPTKSNIVYFCKPKTTLRDVITPIACHAVERERKGLFIAADEMKLLKCMNSLKYVWVHPLLILQVLQTFQVPPCRYVH